MSDTIENGTQDEKLVMAMASKLGMSSADLNNFTEVVGLMRTLDAFSNPMARLGYGQPNLQEGAEYPLTRLSRNYILLQSLYRSNWIARKLIDAAAEDMCKNWIELETERTPKELDDFDAVVEYTDTKAKVMEALKWARLYGGAVAIPMIKGHGDKLDQPLDIEDVELDSYRGLLVLDRWSGVSPGAELVSDLESVDFGLPKYYECTTEDSQTFNVHHSRVFRFTGRGLPSWERAAEMGWGISEIELIFDELKKRDNTSWNIAALIFRANIFAVTQDSLASMLTTTNETAKANLYSAIQSLNHLMSNQGLLVLPKDGRLDQKSYTFSGINDVYQSFMLDICGASEYPMTRLFGRTISGLGQGNEGDEQIYYDTIAQKQNAQLRPAIRKLLPIIAMSTWGKVPKDIRKFSFAPIRTMTEEERSKLSSEATTAVMSVFQGGLIGRQTALKELQQQSTVTGMWTNITDKMIAEADDEVNPGEMGGIPGVPGGVPEAGGMGNEPGEKGKAPGASSEMAPALKKAGLLSPLGNVKKAGDERSEPWVGIDLDGTLAHYDHWRGDKYIGKPIPQMVEFVKDLIESDTKVKIFTARADGAEAKARIRAWLIKAGLPDLEVTNIKDHGMQALYDDRVFRVIRNTGKVKDRKPTTLRGQFWSFLWRGSKTRDDFNENEHPRDKGGKFTEGGWGGSNEKPAPAKKVPLKEWIKNPTLLKTAEDKYNRVQRLKEVFSSIKLENDSLVDKNENAACAALIMSTGIRPGSEKDTHAKVKAYGATTLEGRHVVIDGDDVSLQYVGKKGVNLNIPVRDPKMKQMLIRRKHEAGENGRLFQTKHHNLLDYTHSLDGGEFKIKDFRTHVATVTAEKTVAGMEPPEDFNSYVAKVKAVAIVVSRRLGNTPTVALQSYIDPNVFATWRQRLTA